MAGLIICVGSRGFAAPGGVWLSVSSVRQRMGGYRWQSEAGQNVLNRLIQIVRKVRLMGIDDLLGVKTRLRLLQMVR